MARSSQTETAVLGALSLQPMTGYALRAALLELAGHFWHESFGQIYPTLSRLEAAGLVAREHDDDRGPFHLTAAGRTRLRELLAEPVAPQPVRNGLLLRLFLGHELGAARCRDLVVAHREAVLARMDALAAARAEVEADTADDPESRGYRLLTVSFGEHTARAQLAWAEEALATLDEQEAPGARRGGSSRR